MDGGMLDQIRSESLHIAFLAIVGGVSAATAIIGWFIRRDIRRSEAAMVALKLTITAVDEKVDSHHERRGNEIKDIQYRIGILVAQLKPDCPDITIPDWPSR